MCAAAAGADKIAGFSNLGRRGGICDLHGVGIDHPAGAQEIICEPVNGQVGIDNTPAAGMDDLVVAGINTHVGSLAGLSGDPEENQIADHHIFLGDDNAVFQLGAGPAIQRKAVLAVKIIGKTGSVKTAGTGSAEDIGVA